MKAINIIDQGGSNKSRLPPKPTHCGAASCQNSVDVLLLVTESAGGERKATSAGEMQDGKGNLFDGRYFVAWHGRCARCYDRETRRAGKSTIDPAAEFKRLMAGEKGEQWAGAAEFAKALAGKEGTKEDRIALLDFLSRKAASIGRPEAKPEALPEGAEA